MCLCVVARGKSGRAGGGGAPARRRYHETEGVHLKELDSSQNHKSFFSTDAIICQ